MVIRKFAVFKKLVFGTLYDISFTTVIVNLTFIVYEES